MPRPSCSTFAQPAGMPAPPQGGRQLRGSVGAGAIVMMCRNAPRGGAGAAGGRKKRSPAMLRLSLTDGLEASRGRLRRAASPRARHPGGPLPSLVGRTCAGHARAGSAGSGSAGRPPCAMPCYGQKGGKSRPSAGARRIGSADLECEARPAPGAGGHRLAQTACRGHGLVCGSCAGEAVTPCSPGAFSARRHANTCGSGRSPRMAGLRRCGVPPGARWAGWG